MHLKTGTSRMHKRSSKDLNSKLDHARVDFIKIENDDLVCVSTFSHIEKICTQELVISTKNNFKTCLFTQNLFEEGR